MAKVNALTNHFIAQNKTKPTMDAENTPILLPDRKMTELGLTQEDVNGYPTVKSYDDVLGFAVAEACRKALVGSDGTNLQMIEAIGDRDELIFGQVVLFLVKNQIKPMTDDMLIIGLMVKGIACRLGEGNMRTVNRRAQLKAEGVLTATDIVSAEVRMKWL